MAGLTEMQIGELTKERHAAKNQADKLLCANSNLEDNSTEKLKSINKNVRKKIEVLCALHAFIAQELSNRGENADEK